MWDDMCNLLLISWLVTDSSERPFFFCGRYTRLIGGRRQKRVSLSWYLPPNEWCNLSSSSVFHIKNPLRTCQMLSPYPWPFFLRREKLHICHIQSQHGQAEGGTKATNASIKRAVTKHPLSSVRATPRKPQKQRPATKKIKSRAAAIRKNGKQTKTATLVTWELKEKEIRKKQKHTPQIPWVGFVTKERRRGFDGWRRRPAIFVSKTRKDRNIYYRSIGIIIRVVFRSSESAKIAEFFHNLARDNDRVMWSADFLPDPSVDLQRASISKSFLVQWYIYLYFFEVITHLLCCPIYVALLLLRQ